MRKPTTRQMELFDYIKNFLRRKQYSPSIREIADHFNISVKGAYDHVQALKKKELITHQKNCPRSIGIVNHSMESGDDNIYIPVLGHVAAGTPLFAEENYDGEISLSTSLVGSYRNVFALHVEGDSMIGAAIHDGDLAIIAKQETAENGQIIVARMDEAVTLKRYYKEKNQICLKAENPAYRPMYKRDVQILGRIIMVIRKF